MIRLDPSKKYFKNKIKIRFELDKHVTLKIHTCTVTWPVKYYTINWFWNYDS